MRGQASLKFAAAALALVFAQAASAAETPPRRPSAPPMRPSAAPEGLTPSPLNMLFTPITPCRPGRADIAAGGIVNFQITGACGVPASARAVAVNLSASPTGTGYLTAFPSGATVPTVASLNYRAGQTNTAGSIVPLSAAGSMGVYATAKAKVYVDVTGYYEPQIYAMIDFNDGVYSGSPRVLSAVRRTTGSYSVTIDRDVSFCSVSTQAYTYGYVAHAYAFDGANVSIYTYRRGSDGAIIAADDFSYLKVDC